MQIGEIMSRDVRVISPNDTLREAAKIMREVDTGFLPVGENDRLIGTVTDRDITLRAVADGKDPNATVVRDAMSEHLIYCYEDQDPREAARIMGEKQIRRLPVLNRDKRLVGVLSLGDIATDTHQNPTVGQSLDKVSRESGDTRNLS